MPGGRPTDYCREYCEQVVQAALDGFSLTAFAGMIGHGRATLNVWMAEHPEFKEAVTRAKATRALSWEKRGINVGNGAGGAGAAPMVMFALKNFAPDEFNERREGVDVNVSRERPADPSDPEAPAVEPGTGANVRIHVHFDGD